MISLLGIVAGILLVLTVGQATAAVVRRRETHRVDILFLVIAVFGVVWIRRFGLPGGEVASLFLYLAQPLLTIRLIRHFRRVPAAVWSVALLGFAGASVAQLIWSGSDGELATALYRVSTLLYSVGAFGIEARRVGGVTSRRLLFAALGTLAYVTANLAGVMASMQWAYYPVGQLNEVQAYLSFILYYFAFATPQWLTTHLQDAERAKYLAAVAERDPEERSLEAARDLNAAAARAVGGAASLVALAPAPDAAALRIEAATDVSLVGGLIPVGDRLLSRVWRTGFADSAPVADVEQELVPALSVVGIRVLAAPVATSTRSWGVIVALQTRGSLFPDDDLRLLRHFGRYAATALDHGALVADAKARARRVAEGRLREVESRMALMLDSIKDYAMCVVDSRGRVVNWHTGARQVFGYTSAEMDDEPIAPLLGLASSDLDALCGEARLLGHIVREGPCLRKDGRRFVGMTTMRPLEGDTEGVEGFVLVTRDVTEQRDLEARFRQSQKMEAIGLLAGGIAHDFNNLLTSIGGQCSWLEREVPPTDTRRTYVEAIQTATDRAAALTSQLLAFSRGQVLTPTVLNLTRLVEEMLPMLQRMLGERIEIASQLPTGLSLVRGDRSQIEQVVFNLSLNARDAMPTGGRLAFETRVGWVDESVTVGEARPGTFVQLLVADSGVGMDLETQGRIFDPFFTTKEVGQGTGLGLATVYGIVKQMSGFIRVTSDPGRGTTFRLYFPEASPEPAPPVDAPDLFESLRGTETVLVVEDDEGVRTFVAGALERFGYQVIVARSMTEALALVDAHPDPIDLLVTDVVMPAGTGPELARAVAARRPAAPVLYISGYADTVLSREATVPKASQFLQKPFTAADLLARVRRLLTRTD